MSNELTKKEAIAAKTYYVVGIHDPSLLNTGYPDTNYEVAAKNLKEAVDQAEKIHEKGFKSIHEGIRSSAEKTKGYSNLPPYEYQAKPFAVQKITVQLLSDEVILDRWWSNLPYREDYMKAWEPDITTKAMIAKLKRDYPELYDKYAYDLVEEYNQPLE